MLLFKTILDGVFGEFCRGGCEFGPGANLRLSEEEMQRVVVRVMRGIEFVCETQLVLGLAAEIPFQCCAGCLRVGADSLGFVEVAEQIAEPDVERRGFGVCYESAAGFVFMVIMLTICIMIMFVSA